jgi:hypothetical protein
LYRAVKFIRDQAEATVQQSKEKHRIREVAAAGAQNAANALRKFLVPDNNPRMSTLISNNISNLVSGAVNPMDGWSDGISLWKGHFCLFLKPQIVLRSEANMESVCVLAAVDVKLQSFAIMDDANVEDPVAAKVMTR